MNKLRTATIGLTIVAAVLLVGAQDLSELKGAPAQPDGREPQGRRHRRRAGRRDRRALPGLGGHGARRSRPPDADTVFEIGSITKVFTSLVLADMVVRGEVELDDPVAKFLPPTVKVPERDGRRITLLDLSNQVSGLPRMPDNLKPADGADPYVDYGPARLYEFLAGSSSRGASARSTSTRTSASACWATPWPSRPGWAMRNSSGGGPRAVGHGRYRDRSARALESPLATGSGPNLSPVKNWNFDVFAPAGALRSTARDMLKFLTAAMGLRDTPCGRPST